MKIDISLPQILRTLNGFLLADQVQVNIGNIVFAWEKDIDFQGKTRRISYDCLVSAEDFPGPFAASFAAGPDWFNVGLIPLADGRFLITIAAGRGVGNPHPSINISHELDARAEIILAKALVTAN